MLNLEGKRDAVKGTLRAPGELCYGDELKKRRSVLGNPKYPGWIPLPGTDGYMSINQLLLAPICAPVDKMAIGQWEPFCPGGYTCPEIGPQSISGVLGSGED